MRHEHKPLGRQLRWGAWLLAGAFAAIAATSAAASDGFLKLDGIQGEAVDRGHEGEIVVLSYQHGLNGPYARGAGLSPGAATGKTTCAPVTLTKYVDRASPALISHVATGQHIAKGVISFRRPGAMPFEYYRVTLDDVIVAEIEQTDERAGSTGTAAARMTEKVSLLARRFSFDYAPQMPDGKTGARIAASWDCVAARP